MINRHGFKSSVAVHSTMHTHGTEHLNKELYSDRDPECYPVLCRLDLRAY